MRVTVSTPPPAGTQTMILIGLLGKWPRHPARVQKMRITSTDEIDARSPRTCFLLESPAGLCDTRQLLRRQFQVEQLYRIAAKYVAL